MVFIWCQACVRAAHLGSGGGGGREGDWGGKEGDLLRTHAKTYILNIYHIDILSPHYLFSN